LGKSLQRREFFREKEKGEKGGGDGAPGGEEGEEVVRGSSLTPIRAID